MRGVQDNKNVQRILEHTNGLYAGTCLKVSSFDGYALAEKPFAKPPKKRSEVSKKAHRMLELLCRVHPTHLATHSFIMGMLGYSHNTVYKYIKEASERKLLVIYRLVDRYGKCVGVGYRPVTYLVNYKYAKNANVHPRVRNAYTRTRRIVRATLEEGSVYDVCTRIHTHVLHDQEIHTGSVCTHMHTTAESDQQIRTGRKQKNGGKTTNLVTPLPERNLKPYVSKVMERSATSFNSSSLSVPTSSPGRRTAKRCKESCRNEFRPIVEILLSLSSDASSLDINDLPGPLARSIDYRVNPARAGTLTKQIVLQLRTLKDYDLLPSLTCNALVKSFDKLMLQDKYSKALKDIINYTVTLYAGVFPGQREYHQYKTKLYGLDECIALVQSTLTDHEKFMREYNKQDYSALYNPIALTQAARMHKIDWRWGKTISYEDFYKLDIGSRAWLSHECQRDSDSFWEVFGVEVHCPVHILWWDEEIKARRAFARIGLDFESVKDEIAKAGTNYYDTTNIADTIAPHLNRPEIKNGKQ